MATQPRYFWDSTQRRYTSGVGKIVTPQKVREVLDTVVDKSSKARLIELGKQLQSKAISIPEWYTRSIPLIKQGHSQAAATAAGGMNNLTPSQRGYLGSRLRSEYGYFRQLALDVESGAVKLDGRFLDRLGMYADAAIPTHEEMKRRLEMDAGMKEERNILGSAKHCSECEAETAKGWVEIGTLKAIGSRKCLSKDRCRMEFR
jgi:hypothetical protein